MKPNSSPQRHRGTEKALSCFSSVPLCLCGESFYLTQPAIRMEWTSQPYNAHKRHSTAISGTHSLNAPFDAASRPARVSS